MASPASALANTRSARSLAHLVTHAADGALRGQPARLAAKRFARRATSAGADRFAGLDWDPGRGGVPLLTDALAMLECETVADHPAGDHWIIVAQVETLRITSVEHPLIFFAGAFRALRSPA